MLMKLGIGAKIRCSSLTPDRLTTLLPQMWIDPKKAGRGMRLCLQVRIQEPQFRMWEGCGLKTHLFIHLCQISQVHSRFLIKNNNNNKKQSLVLPLLFIPLKKQTPRGLSKEWELVGLDLCSPRLLTANGMIFFRLYSP